MVFNSCGNSTRNPGSRLSEYAAFFVLLLSLTAITYAQKTSEIDSGLYGNENMQAVNARLGYVTTEIDISFRRSLPL